MKSATTVLASLFALTLLTACEPEVGSDEWCETIKEKGAANTTANEAKDFAEHCVL